MDERHDEARGSAEKPPPPPGPWAERRRLASVMRTVVERLYTTDAPAAELARAADALEAFAAAVAALPRRTRAHEGYSEAANAGDVDAFFDDSPLIGLSNPLSPPIHLRVEGGRVFGTAVFGSAYEGPPGCLHGGFVAAAFDEVLGFAQSLTGNPGMTGTLTIRYRAPTPLNTQLAFEAWVDRVEGRKIFARGTVRAGALLTAEAEGIFISVDAAKFAELVDRAAQRMEGSRE
jgi:acyl-coenzyme A thioesterase PaaI-like protein